MNVLKLLSTFWLILTIQSAFGQYIGYSEIDADNVSKWIPELDIDYYGTYHFGDSEGESTLIFFRTGNQIVAQIKSGGWNADATDWVWEYRNLTYVDYDIEGNFSSNEYKGEFVNYAENEKAKHCLKIYDSWSGVTQQAGEYELGTKTGPVNSMYAGKYILASTQELNPDELTKMSSEELQIMRNEVFARYGYKFRAGGKMDTYFRKQTWYKPQHKDVNHFLTIVETHNIQLIRKEEQRR